MLVSVAAETRPGERRVALTPEAVALLVGQGHDVRGRVRRGAAPLAARRRLRGRRAPTCAAGDVSPAPTWSLHVRPLLPGSGRPAAPRRRHPRVRHRAGRAGRHPRPARRRGHGVRDGAGAADLPGPVDGRADLAGAGRRLPLRAGGGDAAAAVLPAVHDRGRHRAAGPGAGARAPASPGCRRSPPPSRLGAVVEAYDVRPASADEVRRWAPRSSTSTWRRSRAPAATRGSCPQDRAVRQQELLAPYVAAVGRADHHRRGARAAGAAAGDRATCSPGCSRARSWSTWPPRAAATSRARCAGRGGRRRRRRRAAVRHGGRRLARCRSTPPGSTPRTSPTCWR